MSARSRRRRAGTRVRLYPQAPFLDPERAPEIVELSPPAGSVGPGPQDERIYTVFPLDKSRAYGRWVLPNGRVDLYLPPWSGNALPPAMPDPSGHFDHLIPGTPEFEAAHLYGTVRLTLDIWEDYLGHEIGWHFARDFDRLELSIIHKVDNAFMGYGFLETGASPDQPGELRPYSLNFDVVSHEVGHCIIYSLVGIPEPEATEGEYFGFHEAAADAVVLISVLHFDSVVDRLLERSRGNLYTPTTGLNRLAELTDDSQIRMAGNPSTMTDFKDGWSDEHDLAMPLVGAIFDILVDVFHENLLDWGLISPEVEHFADLVQDRPDLEAVMQRDFDLAYERDPAGFKTALLDARDRLGRYVALTFERLSPNYLNYDDVAEVLLGVDLDVTGGRYARLIERNMLRREIGLVPVGPRLPEADEKDSHAFSARSATPDLPRTAPRFARYRDRVRRRAPGMQARPWFQ